MSVQTKMTAIADKIRSLLGLSDAMGLDAMATNLDNANTEVATQEDLIAQIAGVVAEKSPSSFPAGNLTITFTGPTDALIFEDYITYHIVLYLASENGTVKGKEVTQSDFVKTTQDDTITWTATINCVTGTTVYVRSPFVSSYEAEISASDNVTSYPGLDGSMGLDVYPVALNDNGPGNITFSVVM